MKINCVLIGLTLCVAGCGGGGGSGAAGGISVQTPAPIALSSGTTVLSEDKMHVSVDGVLRTLAAPDWQNNLAQHTGSDHAYIARRDQNYVAIAGQFDDKPLSKFWEIWSRSGGRQSYAMTGSLISEVRRLTGQWILVYR